MLTVIARTFLALGVLAAAPLFAQEQEERQEGFLSGGEWDLNARYRMESVEQDGSLQSAFASTLRTSIGFETNPDLAFGAMVEGEDVHSIGAEKFNSTTNGHSQYSIVPDPDSTELNQGYVSWHNAAFRARAGRQAFVLDNARFIGDVGFRQNQQTYDSLTLQATTPGGSRFTYAYLWRVHRFLGRDNPAGELGLRTHVLNYSLGRLNGDRLTAYAYLLEGTDEPLRARSTKTFGASYDGGIDVSTRKILYRAEYAKQSRYADNPGQADVWYGNAELGLRLASQWTITAGLEILSGNGRDAFQTPLATAHKFNGTADVFAAATPENGLEDRYFRVYAPLRGTRLTVT